MYRMASLPPSADPAGAAPSDRLWLRSELMGTQVITRDTGRRLGVVGEVVVDVDRREVVALGLRDNPLTRFLPGLPRWMPLDRIRQVGDVILVDSADSLTEGFNPERYSKVINCQVITESGEQLGRVLGFSFDIETGDLTTLVLGALGLPLLGEGVLSTWELSVEEIVSSGPDRIIVYEGAEEKLKQLGTGLLEKLGIGGPSWEQEERDRYRLNMVPVENQLAAGQPTEQAQRRIQPATTRAFEPEEELEYVELERGQEEPLRQRRYLDEAEDDRYGRSRGNRSPEERKDSWSERATPTRYDQDRYGDERYGEDRYEQERDDGRPGRPRGGPRDRDQERPRSEPIERSPMEPLRELPLKPRASRQSSLEPLDVEPEPYEAEAITDSRRDNRGSGSAIDDPW
jgi:sporulation protein YlmC with PRC-barrel domain